MYATMQFNSKLHSLRAPQSPLLSPKYQTENENNQTCIIITIICRINDIQMEIYTKNEPKREKRKRLECEKLLLFCLPKTFLSFPLCVILYLFLHSFCRCNEISISAWQLMTKNGLGEWWKCWNDSEKVEMTLKDIHYIDITKQRKTRLL